MKYILIASCVLLFSCKKANTNNNDTCSTTVNSGIVGVNSTTLTANVNQDINFEVLYAIANGCATTSNLEILKSGNIITVNMLTKFEGCVCTQVYFEGKKPYIFRSSTAGNFKLKFSDGNGGYIERDVVIQ
jgi:hypothetical protein